MKQKLNLLLAFSLAMPLAAEASYRGDGLEEAVGLAQYHKACDLMEERKKRSLEVTEPLRQAIKSEDLTIGTTMEEEEERLMIIDLLRQAIKSEDLIPQRTAKAMCYLSSIFSKDKKTRPESETLLEGALALEVLTERSTAKAELSLAQIVWDLRKNATKDEDASDVEGASDVEDAAKDEAARRVRVLLDSALRRGKLSKNGLGRRESLLEALRAEVLKEALPPETPTSLTFSSSTASSIWTSSEE